MIRQRPSNRRSRFRLTPAFDRVEARLLPATYFVTTTGDEGSGSLRQAILDANTHPNDPGARDTIAFNIPGTGVHVITPESDLPEITDSLLLDGSTQLTNFGTPAIELDGIITTGDGLTVAAPNTTIQSLIINDFAGSGIFVRPGATGVLIRANQIGTDSSGAIAAGNLGDGITINATGGIVGGSDPSDANVISGNFGNGVTLNGSNNQVAGNRIGTDFSGMIIVANAGDGVQINANNNTIGGSTFAESNLISGNASNGIRILANGNTVLNNLIGTSIGAGIDQPSTNFITLPNGSDGILLGFRASENVIGLPGAGNLIGGNRASGIELLGQSNRNLIQGNGIGATRSVGAGIGIGLTNLANGQDGIRIGLSSLNTIGGSAVGAGNLVSGNSGAGIRILGNDISIPGSPGNLVFGNIVGLTLNGRLPVPNSAGGIVLGNSAHNVIGGIATGEGNVISSNRGTGLTISAAASVGNVVLGNLIGTDPSGLNAFGNAGDGIDILGAPNNVIGGPNGVNVISSNSGHGLLIAGLGASGNLVQSNIIGLSLSGATRGNTGDGIHVSALGNSIGGTGGGDRNVISGNQGHGIVVTTEVTAGILTTGGMTLIQGNLIGLGLNGVTAGQGNQQNGILITNASDNSIGGGTAGAGNFISGNRQNGIQIVGTSTRTVVSGNTVGLNVDGTRGTSGNFLNGLYLQGASGNTVGGISGGDHNVLSGNGAAGLLIESGTANVIQGNLIGTDPTGTLARSNTLSGVVLALSSLNTLGGTSPGASNVISGNNSDGVRIVGPGGSNLVVNNRIGVDIQGIAPLGNFLNGIAVFDSTSNSIGGPLLSMGNVVSANGLSGILISGVQSSGNKIQGNQIGTSAAGTLALGNGLDGVFVDSSPNTTIGGSVPGTGNLISANGGNGVEIRGTTATGDVISGNLIGSDATGSARLGNLKDGILLDSAGNNSIGGLVPGARNVISANGGNGIQLRNVGASNVIVAGNFIGTDASGSVALGNSQNGITLAQGATANLIGGSLPGAGNVISGNFASGLQLFAGATGNQIFGNRIGTDATGGHAVGNNIAGVALNNASDNAIGSSLAGTGNVISGNSSSGISIGGIGAARNQVLGNLIGTDASGSIGVGNSSTGINIDNAPGNLIGGNIVSANRTFGILVINSGATGNLIIGNLIGTNSLGVPGLGNALDGLLINAAQGNTVGGPAAAFRNVLSGNNGNGIHLVFANGTMLQANDVGVDPSATRVLANAFDGILIEGSNGVTITGATRPGLVSGNGRNGIEVIGGSTGTTIQGTQIGTDFSGVFALGNQLDGIALSNSSQNILGGEGVGQGNLISGNLGSGIHLVNSSGNLIRANRVGVSANGTSALGNAGDGLLLQGSSNNAVGGSLSTQGNLISANGGSGIHVVGPDSDGTFIAQNTVGTDSAGVLALGNVNFGVAIEGASQTLVQANLISANGLIGVEIAGTTATGNRVIGNKIGTDRAGGASLSNGYGVMVNGSGGNVIGGIGPNEGNLISGNVIAGVDLFGRFSSANIVVGNRIGTDDSGRRSIVIPGSITAQQVGVLIDQAPGLDVNNNTAVGNVIGGVTPAARNIISGNLVGIEINGADGKGNVILGNYVGPTIDGEKGAGNVIGVFINAAPGNVIGGEAGNVISGNSSVGVYILGNTSAGNIIIGNLIGTTPDGGKALGNQIGIYAENAPGNVIGGVTAATRNVISANSIAGVYLLGGQSVGNTVINNFIGTGSTGTGKLANKQYGVLLFNAPRNGVVRSGPFANRITGSGIANFREFTGKTVVANPSGSVGTPKAAIKVARSTPAGPLRSKASRTSR